MAKELKITRIFSAPRELVWRAFTEPELMRRWWGPAGYTAPSIAIDLREGGSYLASMQAPDGKESWSTGTYREIVPGERIVATDSFADEKGNVVPASYYGMSAMPLELVVTMTFREQKGLTTFTLRHEGFPPGMMAEMARAGWNQSFDKLERVLIGEQAGTGRTILAAVPGEATVTMARVFDAPRERLYRAITDPGLIVQWWAPRRYAISVDRLELRPGGIWRYLNRDDAGNTAAFHGVFHEISPGRIVNTFEYEGMPGHALLGIMTLEERDGRTLLIARSVFESVGDRDGMLVTGMQEGGPETMDRLAELVEGKNAPAAAAAAPAG